MDVDVERQVSQRHQLKDLILDLDELFNTTLALGLLSSSFPHRSAELVGDLFALQNEDDETLTHLVHLLHDLKASLALGTALLRGIEVAVDMLAYVGLILVIDVDSVLTVELV